MLQVRDDGLAFRHELARRAVEQSLSALRLRALHRAVITALATAEPRDLSRLVHHAVRAGDIEAILAYARSTRTSRRSSTGSACGHAGRRPPMHGPSTLRTIPADLTSADVMPSYLGQISVAPTDARPGAPTVDCPHDPLCPHGDAAGRRPFPGR
jgi:hypothetical protein